jgi:hypothetical protein
MTKSKLERFAEIDTFINVFQHLQNQEKVDEDDDMLEYNDDEDQNDDDMEDPQGDLRSGERR